LGLCPKGANLLDGSNFLPAYEDGTSVLKCWHIKLRCRGITQMKTYDIRNTAKVSKSRIVARIIYDLTKASMRITIFFLAELHFYAIQREYAS